MPEILEDWEKVIQISDDNYKYVQHCEVSLNGEDVKKHIKFLKGNVDGLKKMKNELDINKEVNKQIVQFQQEYQTKKEAVKNWDEYVEESVDKQKKKLLESKKEVESFLENFENYKQRIIEQLTKDLEKKKQSIDWQLETDTKKLKTYLNIENNENKTN